MRFSRQIAGVLGAGALLLATGCGGDGSDEENGGSNGSESSESSENGGGSEGEALALDTTAHQATFTDRDETAYQVEVAPVSLARGAESDLENIQLSDDLAGLTPYYLTVSLTAADQAITSLDLGGFNVVGTDGVPGEQITLFGGSGSDNPGNCDTAVPDSLAAGESVEVCSILMMHPDRQPASVAYVDEGSSPLVWALEDVEAGAGLASAGEAVDTNWQDSDGADIPLNVTPTTVVEGSMEDLAAWDVDGEGKTPYYVTIEYRNDSDSLDLYPDMQENVQLRTASGQAVSGLVLLDLSFSGQQVEACPNRVPDDLAAPGATVTQCSVHMVQEGDVPAAIGFNPRGADPVAWSVPATE